MSASGFIQVQKRNLCMLIVPVASIISAFQCAEHGGTVLRMRVGCSRGRQWEYEDVELADTMAMVAGKLGCAWPAATDLERGRIKVTHEHAAMLEGLRTIARMERCAAVLHAQETLRRLGLGWE